MNLRNESNLGTGRAFRKATTRFRGVAGREASVRRPRRAGLRRPDAPRRRAGLPGPVEGRRGDAAGPSRGVVERRESAREHEPVDGGVADGHGDVG